MTTRGNIEQASLPTQISESDSFEFAWRGPGIANSNRPLEPTTLTVQWQCEELGDQSQQFDLDQVVQNA